jgi:uncharacterized membrane protein (DUF2068 family)
VDWNQIACARGHLTYAPDEQHLHEHLHVATTVGEAWRCLRCGDYVVGPPRHSGPADHAPVPLRGQMLRDAIVLRVLAVDRWLRGLVILLAAYGVWRFRADRNAIRRNFNEDLPLLQPLAEKLGWHLQNSSLLHTFQRILQAQSSTLAWVTAGLAAYGLLQVVEGTGLWLLRRWGEYFAAVATSLFIPVEVYELVERITWLRAGALIINLGAVFYLVYRKRLFGARGGRAAYEAERETESLIMVAVAAGEASRTTKATRPSRASRPRGRGRAG